MSEPRESEAGGLIRRARHGEDDALGELFQRYHNYIALLARLGLTAELRTKLDPSDAVQETLLQAYRSFPKFQGVSEGEFPRWLKAILVKRLATLTALQAEAKALLAKKQ